MCDPMGIAGNQFPDLLPIGKFLNFLFKRLIPECHKFAAVERCI